MGARRHDLKTWPSFFAALVSGDKTFEIRRNVDRDFAVGDELVLHEWDPTLEGFSIPKGYTGRSLRRVVSYVMSGGRFGIDPAFCVLGLRADDTQESAE